MHNKGVPILIVRVGVFPEPDETPVGALAVSLFKEWRANAPIGSMSRSQWGPR